MMENPAKGASTAYESRSVNEPGNRGLIDLRKHLSVLWYRRWLIVLCVIAAVAMTLAYLAVTPAEYTAVATVLIDPRQEQIVDANSVLPNIGADSAAVTSQVNVLESRGLLEQVFNRLDLVADPEFSQPGLFTRLSAMLQGKAPTASSAGAFDEFRRRVKVQRIGLTYVLEIRFTSNEPAKASDIAAAIVEGYLSGLADEKSDANLSVTRELDSRIATLRTSLSQAELAVERFKVEHNMLSGSGSNTVMQSQIDQVTAQLSVAQEQAREAFARADQARSALETTSDAAGLDDLLVSDVGAQLRTQYNQRSAQILSMLATMGPRHPSLLAAEAELAGLTSMMRAEAQRTVVQLEGDARLAQQNVASTEEELARLASQSNELDRASVTLRQLERDADVARSLLEDFMRRSLETGELGTMQRSEAKVLSAAAEPRSATWPKANLLLALAVGLGCALGCGVALVLGGPARALTRTSTPPTLPTTPSGRAPSFARAGMAWKTLGSISPRPASGSVARIAAHLDELRTDRGSFFAGISTISLGQLQSHLTYALAEHYAARSVRTVILDLNVSRRESDEPIDVEAIEVLSAFGRRKVQVPRLTKGRPFLIIDDRASAQPVGMQQLDALEKWAVASGFELILVNMPPYHPQRWSGAVAARLDAETIVLRTEEVAAEQILAFASFRADIACPVACVTAPTVPTIISSNNNPGKARSKRVMQ